MTAGPRDPALAPAPRNASASLSVSSPDGPWRTTVPPRGSPPCMASSMAAIPVGTRSVTSHLRRAGEVETDPRALAMRGIRLSGRERLTGPLPGSWKNHSVPFSSPIVERHASRIRWGPTVSFASLRVEQTFIPPSLHGIPLSEEVGLQSRVARMAVGVLVATLVFGTVLAAVAEASRTTRIIVGYNGTLDDAARLISGYGGQVTIA